MAIAIGDIHGCLTSLERLVAKLPPTETLVFLGDYIDRGPHSAGVIAYVQHLARSRPCHLLIGNHEELLLESVENPRIIPSWAENGGRETLRSYGAELEAWSVLTRREAAFGSDYAFYQTLAPYWEDDDAIYVHAGVDVRIPNMVEQDPKVLRWTRESFLNNAGEWRGKPVIFGHTPTRKLGLPDATLIRRARCTGIDTGCVYGGVLTALDSRTQQVWQERSDIAWKKGAGANK